MSRRRISSRPAFTRVELVTLFIVVGVFLALLPACMQKAREEARLAQCKVQLKCIVLALHNYSTARKMLPPAVTCSAANTTADAANPWADAKLTTKGASGTSWILLLLPYIEAEPTFRAWNFEYGVGDTRPYTTPGTGNQGTAAAPGPAMIDIKGLYCPTRRSALRRGFYAPMKLSSAWTGGGTDYGGCIGRHQGFLLDADQSVALPSADGRLTLRFVPGVDVADTVYRVDGDISGPDATCEAKTGFGIFGQVNASTRFAQIKDGTSNTIMTGELQRITHTTTVGPFTASSGPVYSHDGWAIGGSATLFTTGYPYPQDEKTYRLMNNGHFMSPGSEHSGGANFGLADGSVRFISMTVDPNILALLGDMASGFNQSRFP